MNALFPLIYQTVRRILIQKLNICLDFCGPSKSYKESIWVRTNIYIYRVIHEECHSFRELICHVMLMKKVHMNMGPIFHITGDMRSTIFEIEL